MKKILKTALSGIIIMGIFATSFIMPVSAEETSTSSNDTITVFWTIVNKVDRKNRKIK